MHTWVASRMLRWHNGTLYEIISFVLLSKRRKNGQDQMVLKGIGVLDVGIISLSLLYTTELFDSGSGNTSILSRNKAVSDLIYS